MIEPRTFYDAFPDDGLTAQYKPFILKETQKYTRRYKLPLRRLLDDAIRISERAERTFEPERGYDFSTYLGPRLQRLNRIAQQILTDHYGRPRWRRASRPSYRVRAMHTFNQYPIRWHDHRQALLELDQKQRNSLRTYEKAILDWMIDPGRRTLVGLAKETGITKGWASKIRYRLLLLSHAQK